MLIRRAPDVRSSEITDERLYLNRREFIRAAGSAAVAAGTVLAAGLETPADAQTALASYKKNPVGPFHTDEPLNSFADITGYNNFYEFGSDKSDPQRYGGRLKTRPWTIKVDGLCSKPADYSIDDLIKPEALEERVY